MKHLAVMGKRNMDIGALFKQSADERGSYVSQAACFGGKVVGHITHPGREVGNFRRNDQNTRFYIHFFLLAFASLPAYARLPKLGQGLGSARECPAACAAGMNRRRSKGAMASQDGKAIAA